MTQQQIKRQNRKKITNIALIGLMAVLLVLGIFATINSQNSASAYSQPKGYTDVGPLTVKYCYEVGEDIIEQNKTFNHAYKTLKPTRFQWTSATINVTEKPYISGTGVSTGLYTYDDGLFADDTGWYKGYAVFFYTIEKGSDNYITLLDDGSNLYICNNDEMSFTANLGNQVSLPETPTAPEGKQFAGWYYDTAFTQPYQEGDVITSDTSLYAKFVDKNYTVTYVLNGASYSSAQVVHGAKTENVAITVGTGKEFSGWFTDAACTQAYNFDTAVTADVTLYGKIQTIMCTVTFYVGSEVLTTLSVPYGSTLVAYAASASAEADVAQAILNVYNLGNFDTAAAIEEDTEVTATLNEGLLKWNNFGLWFMNNWKWLSACAGLAIVIIVGAVLTKKRR